MANSPQFSFYSKEMFILNTADIIVGNSLRFLAAVLNSNLIGWYCEKIATEVRGETRRYFQQYVSLFPISTLSETKKKHFEIVVDKIQQLKEEGKDTSDVEKQIDRMVYELYELTDEEIRLIEGKTFVTDGHAGDDVDAAEISDPGSSKPPQTAVTSNVYKNQTRVSEKIVINRDVSEQQVQRELEADEASTLGSPGKKNEEIFSTAAPRSLDDISEAQLLRLIRTQMRSLTDETDKTWLFREMAKELGFKRTGSKIRERFEKVLNTAAKRLIITKRADAVYRKNESITDYDDEWLSAKLQALVKNSETISFEELVNRIKVHLGFARATESFKQKIEASLKIALREGALIQHADGIGK